MNQLPIKDFTRGLTQKEDPEHGLGLYQCENLDFIKVGSIRSTKKNKVSINYGSPVKSLGFKGIDDRGTLLAMVGTTLYRGESALKSDFTDQPTEFASQSNRIYTMNVSDGMWMYKDETPMYRAGSPVPATTPTTAVWAGGTGFTGDYNIKVTFNNDNAYDGNASDVVATPTLADEGVSLTSVPVNSDSEYNVTSRKIWIQGGTSPIYADYVLAATISGNSITYVDFEKADVSTTTLLSTDNDLPTKGKLLRNHYNTGFIGNLSTDNNKVQYSKAGLIEQWPSGQTFNVSESGDPLMGMESWNAQLWFVTRMGIYQMIGSPGSGTLITNFQIKQTQSSKGTISGRSVVPTPKGMYFWAEDAIRVFNGSTSQVFSDDCEDEVNKRNPNDAMEELTVGAYWDDKLVMSYVAKGSTVPNRSLVYDFRRNTWSAHNKGYYDLVTDRANNVLYAATASGIEVYRAGEAYADWKLETQDFNVGSYTYGAWGKFQFDMQGSATCKVYVDDELQGTYSLSAPSRDFVSRRFPLGLGSRVSFEVSGDEKTTQDILYSLAISAEAQRGKV